MKNLFEPYEIIICPTIINIKFAEVFLYTQDVIHLHGIIKLTNQYEKVFLYFYFYGWGNDVAFN